MKSIEPKHLYIVVKNDVPEGRMEQVSPSIATFVRFNFVVMAYTSFRRVAAEASSQALQDARFPIRISTLEAFERRLALDFAKLGSNPTHIEIFREDLQLERK